MRNRAILLPPTEAAKNETDRPLALVGVMMRAASTTNTIATKTTTTKTTGR